MPLLLFLEIAQHICSFSMFSLIPLTYSPPLHHTSRKSRRYWDGVTPSDFLNTFVNTR